MLVRVLGRKGELTQLLKSLGDLPKDQRKTIGQAANELRDWAQQHLDAAKIDLLSKNIDKSLAEETIDVTLPGRKRNLGAMHPITTTCARLEDLFINLGFSIAEGPHIETIYYNFDALNTPYNHPSREEADTFYTKSGPNGEYFVLRTHTSPVQVRTMEAMKPPIRIIAPGKVFRRDEIDATHTPVFHQMEGLVIDKNITMGDLKGIMEIFARHMFGSGTSVRLRPSYFPFTEPSAEVDIACYACKGHPPKDGCRICKDSGWVELLGCGMVHPKVLEMSGIDPTIYSGYAFGLGVSRIATAVYGITDPRQLFENDVQFLGQF